MSDQQADSGAPNTSPIADLIFVRIPYVVTGVMFFAAIAINFANVIARYFFFEAFYWAEEVLIYLAMWGVMLAAATITYQGLHIKMDLFATMLRTPFREIVATFTTALMILATLYVIVQSYTVAGMFLKSGEVSISAGIPLVIPHASVLVGFALMAIATIVRLRSYITGRFE